MWRVLIWLVLASTLGVVDLPWLMLTESSAVAATRSQVGSTTFEPLSQRQTPPRSPSTAPRPKVLTILTNSFGSDNPDFGTLLLSETVDGNEPLLATNTFRAPFSTNAVISIGTTNQWHFYVITNDTGFTNAVFLTFLSQPPWQFPVGTNPLARSEIDLDLYVSHDPGLTNLDSVALAQADVSLGAVAPRPSFIPMPRRGSIISALNANRRWALATILPSTSAPSLFSRLMRWGTSCCEASLRLTPQPPPRPTSCT